MRIMSDTPTAALVEEALIQDALELCGTRYELEAGYKHRLLSELAHALRRTIAEREEAQRDAESYKRQTQEVSAKAIELTKEVCAKLDHAIAERDELRATVTRLNRRAQTAEAGVRDNVEACKAAGVSMGRTLANAAADMYLRRAEQAEAERDAQHAEVLRLTEERDEARLRLKASEEGLRVVTMERDHAQQVEAPDAFWQRDEARAQVWGLICAGSNMDDHFQKLWESLLAKTREHFAQFTELTATRDLLLTENARLQQQLSRPDPVVHETPVDGVVPCCGQKLHDLKDGSRVNEGPLVNCDRMRLLTRVSELSSANLVLTAENARLQKELERARNLRRETLGVRMIDNLTTQLVEVTRQRDEAYDTQFAVMWGYICLGTNTRDVQDFVEVGLPAVARKVKALEDHIATLELLRRGGK